MIRPWCAAVQDKINAFWEISKKELEDKKAELRNKDREQEEMEERHQVEIKVRALRFGHWSSSALLCTRCRVTPLGIAAFSSLV